VKNGGGVIFDSYSTQSSYQVALCPATTNGEETESIKTSLGVALVLVGMGLGIYVLKNFLHANQAIKNGTYMPKNTIIYSAGVGLVIFGVVIIAYLIFLPF
jgi:uncharacterized membrane protein YidH (DUF202 family)